MTSLQTHSLQTRRGRAATHQAAARSRRRLLRPAALGWWAIAGHHLHPPHPSPRPLPTQRASSSPHTQPSLPPPPHPAKSSPLFPHHRPHPATQPEKTDGEETENAESLSFEDLLQQLEDMARHSKYSRGQRSRSHPSRSKIGSRTCRALTHRVLPGHVGLQPGCMGCSPDAQGCSPSLQPGPHGAPHRVSPPFPPATRAMDGTPAPLQPCGVVHPGAPRRAHPRGRRALHRARRVRPRAALHTHTAQPAHSPAAAEMTPSVPTLGRARDSGRPGKWHARAHSDVWYLKGRGRGLRWGLGARGPY